MELLGLLGRAAGSTFLLAGDHDVLGRLFDKTGDDVSQLSRIPAIVLGHTWACLPTLHAVDVATVHQEDSAGHGASSRFVRTEPHDRWRDVVGVAGIELRGVFRFAAEAETLGHPRSRTRRNSVHCDAEPGQFLRGDDGERADSGLGRAVVRLALIAEQTRGAAGVMIAAPSTGVPALNCSRQ